MNHINRFVMKIKQLCSSGFALLSILGLMSCGGEQKKSVKDSPVAPMAKKIAKTLKKHGHERSDPYYWLNDRENPEVIQYLEDENEYTNKSLAHTKTFQGALYDEMLSRIDQSDESVPRKDNGYYYYSRYEEGKEYPVFCRKKGSLDAEEEIMLDQNVLAEGHEYYSIGSMNVSESNRLLAYSDDNKGRRKYSIRFKDLETGKDLADVIPNTTGSVAWASDNKTVFYTIKDASLRSYKIIRHILGTDASKDVEVYHESDETFGTFVYKTKSDKYLVIGSYSTLSSEYRVLDASKPMGEFEIIQKREKDLEYSISHYKDHFYILTNYGGAKNFRLMKTSIQKTEKENWEEIIAHRDDVFLEDMDLFKDYLVLNERKNGLMQVRIINWNGKDEHYLDFGEAAYTAYPSVNTDFDTEMLRFDYSSFSTPYSQYEYNMKTKEKHLLKQQKVLGGKFHPEDYAIERFYVKARDGVDVPVSLVYNKSMKKEGGNPTLLYSYGSYGSSTDVYFNSSRLSLLDRGFVYAIAHIRGGQELGRQWYENGKLLKKKNTFTDFIDCGHDLIKRGYTKEDELFALGGSAGGLLMGAVANMDPKLFRGVVANVPFVDVVTTMLDESIPLTTGEYDEWGNPNDKEYYDYMLSYSPYDNVTAQEYPAMLVLTGLHDSQVQYWEPAKWVARLREMKTDDNPLYLDTNMNAGHGGASGRFERLKRTALEYAFMMDLIGIKE